MMGMKLSSKQIGAALTQSTGLCSAEAAWWYWCTRSGCFHVCMHRMLSLWVSEERAGIKFGETMRIIGTRGCCAGANKNSGDGQSVPLYTAALDGFL